MIANKQKNVDDSNGFFFCYSERRIFTAICMCLWYGIWLNMNFCGLQTLHSKHWNGVQLIIMVVTEKGKTLQLKTNNDRCSFIFPFFRIHFGYKETNVYKNRWPFLTYSMRHLMCASVVWFIKSNKQIVIYNTVFLLRYRHLFIFSQICEMRRSFKMWNLFFFLNSKATLVHISSIEQCTLSIDVTSNNILVLQWITNSI